MVGAAGRVGSGAAMPHLESLAMPQAVGAVYCAIAILQNTVMHRTSIRLFVMLSIIAAVCCGNAAAHALIQSRSFAAADASTPNVTLARNDHHDRGRHDKGLHKGWYKGKGHHRDHGRSLEMRGPTVVLPTPPRPPLPPLPRLPSPPLDPRDLPRPPMPHLPRP